MAGKKTVERLEFQSLLGRVVFASQALYKLKGVIPALLGVMEQHWASKDVLSLSKEVWFALRWAASILLENDGMVFCPETRDPGADERPVVWIFTDAARNPDAPASQFVGWGWWIWIEGCDHVYVCNGKWLNGEQELDSTSLEMLTANIALEQAQWVMLQILGEEFAADCDVIMVGDNKSAKDVTCFVRATSPPLRVLVGQRMARKDKRPGQRILPLHSFRELSEEADDLSKNEWHDMVQKINKRFGRKMKIMVVPQPARDVRSSALALATHRRSTK